MLGSARNRRPSRAPGGDERAGSAQPRPDRLDQHQQADPESAATTTREPSTALSGRTTGCEAAGGSGEEAADVRLFGVTVVDVLDDAPTGGVIEVEPDLLERRVELLADRSLRGTLLP